MKSKPYMLATDLDGTLVGDKEALHKLLRYFDKKIYDIALIYITGRHYASALSLIESEALPMPDVLISDVGTSIYMTKSTVEDKDWTKKMQTDWQPDLVEEIASQITALTKQLLPDNGRISFTTQSGKAPVIQLEKALIVNNVSHKLIFSSNRDVDILPRNSGKGEALTYVLEKYSCASVNVLVAGDSGNDIEMLSLGHPSVIVGNAQDELSSLEVHPQLYRSVQKYAGGIHEAWMHFYDE
ncbi:HAD-IIB family hydrolase [Sporosarcina sp. FA9]|uniref:HAD-IIB family hydrolase n=1 Tax=Sporosarcina sp. FA9 TaxID=3413030 RepID=UPI003F6582DD